MTRETKAGLVVSGSFVGLVALVVVCKFKEKAGGPEAAGRADSTLAISAGPAAEAAPAVSPAPAKAGGVTPPAEKAAETPRPVSPAEALALQTPPTSAPPIQQAAATLPAPPGTTAPAPATSGLEAPPTPSAPPVDNSKDHPKPPPENPKSSSGLVAPPWETGGTKDASPPGKPASETTPPAPEKKNEAAAAAPVVKEEKSAAEPPAKGGPVEKAGPGELAEKDKLGAATRPRSQGVDPGANAPRSLGGELEKKMSDAPVAPPFPGVDKAKQDAGGPPPLPGTETPAPAKETKSGRDLVPPADGAGLGQTSAAPGGRASPPDKLVMPPPPPAASLPDGAGAAGGKSADTAAPSPSTPPAPSGEPGPGINLRPPVAGARTESGGGLPNDLTSRPPAPAAENGADRVNVRLGALNAGQEQLALGPTPPNPGDGNRGVPPLGTPATTGSAPIPVPVPPATTTVPMVESYDEEMYPCKAEDSFDSICERFYHAKKYAQALVLFNRDHPRGADGVCKDPPTLAAGQVVYLPPLWVLERRYGQAIPDHTPLPSAASLVSPPVPAGPARNPAPAAAGSSGGWTGANAERQYKVRKDGETFYEIARHTLGNPDRWGEIYRLNPRYEPQNPVPAGTVLRMPAGARVEAGDVP